jgi:hypothetical protein
MGDHATNIAEAVYYMVQGHTLWRERPKADITPVVAVAMSTQARAGSEGLSRWALLMTPGCAPQVTAERCDRAGDRHHRPSRAPQP